jgi:hypothetical protein
MDSATQHFSELALQFKPPQSQADHFLHQHVMLTTLIKLFLEESVA